MLKGVLAYITNWPLFRKRERWAKKLNFKGYGRQCPGVLWFALWQTKRAKTLAMSGECPNLPPLITKSQDCTVSCTTLLEFLLFAFYNCVLIVTHVFT